jgi:hypothetical protein
MEAAMKKILLIVTLTLLATNVTAHEPYKPSLPDFSRDQARKEMKAQMHINNAIAREIRETGRVTEKDALDVYNMEQGYGYDGGYDYDYEDGYDDY